MKSVLSIASLVLLAQSMAHQPASPHSSQASPSRQAECRVEKEEAEVYVDFLKGEPRSPFVQVVVTETEDPKIDVDYLNLHLAARGYGVPPDVRADFKQKNKIVCTLKPIHAKNFRFISKKEIDKIFASGGWSEFRKRYSQNSQVIRFSRVGFNSNRTLALLHVHSGIGPMGGGGMLYVLRRLETGWVVKTYIITWST